MNQNPEQKARDNIDKQLISCGWIIQNKNQINLFAGTGVAVTRQTLALPIIFYLLIKNLLELLRQRRKMKDTGLQLLRSNLQSML